MCRFVAYLGKPILADEILLKPINSLFKQSYHALETEMTVNGDGFGVGWYNPSVRKEPALFRSIRPAWNDENLKYNASMIKTRCFLAHIRAATQGSVSIENCHPFQFKEYLMMQNGGIQDFSKIKRSLINRLDEESFQWIQGQTDTQYIFALFMTIVKEKAANQSIELEDLATCFSETFAEIEELKNVHHLESPSLYNMVLTNGKAMIATKYSTQPEIENRSLYIASDAECFIGDDGFLKFRESVPEDFSVLISSERLSPEKSIWQKIPENRAILVDEDLNVQITPMI